MKRFTDQKVFPTAKGLCTISNLANFGSQTANVNYLQDGHQIAAAPSLVYVSLFIY